MVDLEYYKFEYKDKIYTQLQVIDRIIELTDYIIDNNYYEMMWSDIEHLEAMKNEIFDLFKISFSAMWWWDIANPEHRGRLFNFNMATLFWNILLTTFEALILWFEIPIHKKPYIY